jgi:Mrp family chromosome partitioning ATPase
LTWGRSATSGEKFIQQWFTGLREKHDYVLIDCPSLNTSRAATILGPQCDGLLMVVGTGKATRAQVRGGLAMLTLASVKVVGLALNKRTYPVPEAVYNLL